MLKKRTLAFLLSLFLLPLMAAEFPQSVVLESGSIKVRLDAKKMWNINRIEWRGELVCVDTPWAHYGTACRLKGSPHFIGSGHNESGSMEKVDALKLFVDGAEVVPGESALSGKVIRLEKTSSIAVFQVKYAFEIKDDIISEETEVSASEDVQLQQLYCGMHPWAPRFTDYCVIDQRGKKNIGSFRADEDHRNRNFVPYFNWYDRKSGIIVSTVAAPLSFGKNSRRMLWDRKIYKKDYVCLVMNDVFPAGQKAVCRVRTGFSKQEDAQKWVSDAETLCKVLDQFPAEKAE